MHRYIYQKSEKRKKSASSSSSCMKGAFVEKKGNSALWRQMKKYNQTASHIDRQKQHRGQSIFWKKNDKQKCESLSVKRFKAGQKPLLKLFLSYSYNPQNKAPIDVLVFLPTTLPLKMLKNPGGDST